MAKVKGIPYLLVVFLFVVLLSLVVYRFFLKETFAPMPPVEKGSPQPPGLRDVNGVAVPSVNDMPPGLRDVNGVAVPSVNDMPAADRAAWAAAAFPTAAAAADAAAEAYPLPVGEPYPLPVPPIDKSIVAPRYYVMPTDYDANCWNDKAERAVGSDFTRIKKDNIKDINTECLIKAIEKKDSIFAIQDGNACFTGKGDGYKKYGRATGCGEGGGTWKQRVYKVERKYVPTYNLTNYGIPMFE